MLQYKVIVPTRSIKFSRIDLSTITYKFHDFLRHYRIDYPTLTLKKFKSDSPAIEAAFGGSDASGAWDWKMAYDACEAAFVLFLRKYGDAILRKAGSVQAGLPMMEWVAGLLPTHTRRSEDSQTMQQFSTPAPLALAAAVAAGINPGDVVLEPSAGTCLLAAMAWMLGSDLALNELSDLRALDTLHGSVDRTTLLVHQNRMLNII